MLANRALGERGGLFLDEPLHLRVVDDEAGVVLEARDVRGRADGGDVPCRVGRVDDHERVVVVAVPVSFGVELHGRMPVAGRLQQGNDAVVLQHEQFREIPREPPRSEVRPVRTDGLEEAFEHADVACEAVGDTRSQVGVVKGRPVDRRPRRRGVLDVVTRHQVDVEAVHRARDVRVLGVLLVPLGEHLSTDDESVLLEFRAVEARREADEQVDVAVTRQPRPACGRPDLEDVGLGGDRRRQFVLDGAFDPRSEFVDRRS